MLKHSLSFWFSCFLFYFGRLILPSILCPPLPTFVFFPFLCPSCFPPLCFLQPCLCSRTFLLICTIFSPLYYPQPVLSVLLPPLVVVFWTTAYQTLLFCFFTQLSCLRLGSFCYNNMRLQSTTLHFLLKEQNIQKNVYSKIKSKKSSLNFYGFNVFKNLDKSSEPYKLLVSRSRYMISKWLRGFQRLQWEVDNKSIRAESASIHRLSMPVWHQ